VSYPPEQVIADMIMLIRAQERNAEGKRIIKAVTNASTQIADLYWYRDAGRPEEAFQFLLSVIKGEQPVGNADKLEDNK